jgi:hypothetical protein
VKKNILSSIYSFRRGNYIFHKLSMSTEHVEVQLFMNPWQFFVENRIELISLVFFEELQYGAMWLKLPKD